MRTWGLLLAVSFVAAACTGGDTTSTSSVSPPPVWSSTAPITLEVDLSAPPVRWDRVMTIPFGQGREQLGLEPTPAGLNVLPSSFAIASDGSVWIADPVKARIVRFRPDGAFASAIAIRGKSSAVDLIFVSDRAVMLRRFTGWIWSDGSRAPVTLGGVHISPYALMAGASVPMASDALLGLLSIDPATGEATRLEDLTLQDGTGIAVTENAPGGPELGMVLRRGDAHETVPIVATTPDGATATVGPMIEAVLPDAIAAWTPVQNAGEGGSWYLEFAGDGSVRAFDRLPDAGIDDWGQLRHLTVGPDGAVYLMVPGPRGETIYRRP